MSSKAPKPAGNGAGLSISTENNLRWWQRSVVYQIYPRSFQDSNGDGIGDLKGITQRLDHLVELGVDALWLSPFYKSPMKDFGYDISDYCDVDPIFGTLEDFDNLVKAAHSKGLKVLVDLVPNHTSDLHPWFLESRSSRHNPKRDWYVWADPAEDGGPPNNWQSCFGGPAWEYDEKTGQYYLHHFLKEQPDLNYHNEEVEHAITDVMRFWLKRGVDGFRVDVLYMLVEDPELRDEPPNPGFIEGHHLDRDRTIHTYTDDQPGTHAVARRMRHLLDEFTQESGKERIMIGEIYLPLMQLFSYYGTTDEPECHLPFNFHLITRGLQKWTADCIKEIVDEYEMMLPEHGEPNWVLGNHDQPRMASLIGKEQARVATMMLFTLRGTITWYQGDEIGLLNGVVRPHQMRDPAGLRQPHAPQACRDPSRTPMQWDASPNAGFCPEGVTPWLPINEDYKTCNVQVEREDPTSMLYLVKALIRIRKENSALYRGAYNSKDLERTAPPGVFAYARESDQERAIVLLNFTKEEKHVPIDLHDLEQMHVLVSTHMDMEQGAPVPTKDGETVYLRPDEGLTLFWMKIPSP